MRKMYFTEAEKAEADRRWKLDYYYRNKERLCAYQQAYEKKKRENIKLKLARLEELEKQAAGQI